MAKILKSFDRYIYDTIGVSVSSCIHTKITSLPFFILDEYHIYKVDILHKKCILLVSKTADEISPATIRKHVEIVRDKVSQDVIFVHPAISSYNRKRLIESRVSFVVPGNQMYLPELMIDLREHFHAVRSRRSKFSPSTQVVILYMLHNFLQQPFIPSDLAKDLGYSNTTMTRAFDEIEAVGIGRHDIAGRQRLLSVEDGRRELWHKAIDYLGSPIKSQVLVRTISDELRRYQAGETELSHHSMLAETRVKTFAVKKEDWDFCKRRDLIEEVKFSEDAKYQLQIWSYAPELFAENGSVDKFSLYLSLKDNEDERVQLALEAMMESIEW